jgi:hypothetical protein
VFAEITRIINSEEVSLEEIQETVVFLQKSQFIYRDKKGHTKHWKMIDKYFSMFSSYMEMSGAILKKDDEYNYFGYLPTSEYYTADLQTTAILVTLRLIYHRKRLEVISDGVDVVVSGMEFQELYGNYTGRSDLNNKSQFAKAFQLLKTKSLVEISTEVNEFTNMPDIIILPAIEMAVTESYASELISRLNKRNNATEG